MQSHHIVSSYQLTYISIKVQNPRAGVLGKTFPSAADLDEVSKTSEKLASFKANVLRTTSLGTVEWTKKDGGKWEGGVQEGKGLKNADGVVPEGMAPRSVEGGPKSAEEGPTTAEAAPQ